MMLSTGGLMAPGMRPLGRVPWNQDGCHGFAVELGADVPSFDDSMIRSALIRGSLVCKKVDGLSRAINRQLWAIGYVARVKSDPADCSVVVEISNSR